ncbi:MAG: type II toxin-antitoxin system RelE/ParE family toxin [Chitinophagaceae bacterium]|nr:type II toxin-antitoxin system RelE/ParE family toxin [Chitinophagaceae bacterium]
MAYKILYFDEARLDIQEAKLWYRTQLKGLERRFAEDIKNAILRLKERPSVHAIRYQNIRIAHPDVFPYSVHFYIDEENKTVVIISIVHNSRDPLFTQERTSILNEPDAEYVSSTK